MPGGLQENFQPRAGVAWAPRRRTVAGARGVGLYHNWIPLGEANASPEPSRLVTTHFPHRRSIEPILSIGTSDRPPSVQLPRRSRRTARRSRGHRGRAARRGRHRRTLRRQHADLQLGVERAVAKGIVAGVAYSGSYTWNGLFGSDFKTAPGRPAGRPSRSPQPQLRQRSTTKLTRTRSTTTGCCCLAPTGHAPQQLPGRLHLVEVEDYGQAGTP